MTWLEQTRNKTDAEKRILAFNISFAATLVIFSIWLVGTFYSVQSSDISTQVMKKTSPAASIGSSIKNIFTGKEAYKIEN